MSNRIIQGDCLKVMADMESDSVDLVFGSPPYEDARTYGIDFRVKGQDWVDWMVQICTEASRVSKGLVAFVVQGRTRKFKWSCTPALLIVDLHRAGFNVRNPAMYQRSGIPGSGGPDWLRSDYEWIICVSPPGQLAWSDNVACGEPPKCKPGGKPTHRGQNGMRRSSGVRRQHGYTINEIKVANPGNVIKCSGGHVGSKLAHENEAPFPEKLAEFFVKSFCPPKGTVLDPFSGSGTTIAVADKNGRNGIGIDVRESQIELAQRRLQEAREDVQN